MASAAAPSAAAPGAAAGGKGEDDAGFASYGRVPLPSDEEFSWLRGVGDTDAPGFNAEAAERAGSGAPGAEDEDDDIAMLVQSMLARTSSPLYAAGGAAAPTPFGPPSTSGAPSTVPSSWPAAPASAFDRPAARGPAAAAPGGAAVEFLPTVADDYIRNFLVRNGMTSALDAFNTEWYEMKARGTLPDADALHVDDIYAQNERLSELVGRLKAELGHAQEVATRAQSTWEKLRRERDFHRMHHKRVVQEKQKLITDLKKLKSHFDAYEPAMRELRSKYEVVMRDKMLLKVERDRLAARVSALEAQLAAYDESGMPVGSGGGTVGGSASPFAMPDGAATVAAAATARVPLPTSGRRAAPSAGTTGRSPTRTVGTAGKVGAGGRAAAGGTAGSTRAGAAGGLTQTRVPDTRMPEDMINPYLNLAFEPAHASAYTSSSMVRAHGAAVSSIAFHPTKPVLATVSDDATWRLWAMPDSELIMSGEGHRTWLADVDFHPAGSHLATCSGDGCIKVWDLTSAACAATFTDHTQTTWSVAFHAGGDFLASGSMDHTCRLFDVHTGRVRQTLRGHVDSINAVAWQPFAVNLASGSGDKTVSLWDVRTGLCVQTFYGHTNAVNDVVFSLRGDAVASCDADGVVRVWDIRMVSERASATLGKVPVHSVAFDRSAAILTAACDDGSIHVLDAGAGADATLPVPGKASSRVATLKPLAVLRGHTEAVQSLAFDPTSTFLASAGNDCTVRLWSEPGVPLTAAAMGGA